MACCIFASWLIRTLVIGPLRALLGRDPSRGDAYATAPKGVRWRPAEEVEAPAYVRG